MASGLQWQQRVRSTGSVAWGTWRDCPTPREDEIVLLCVRNPEITVTLTWGDTSQAEYRIKP